MSTISQHESTLPPSTTPRPIRAQLPSKPTVVVPPINFALVAPGIYRSGHPNKKNFSFLRRLGLKTVVYVEGTDEYRKDSKEFVEQEGMQLVRCDLSKEEVSLGAGLERGKGKER